MVCLKDNICIDEVLSLLQVLIGLTGSFIVVTVCIDELIFPSVKMYLHWQIVFLRCNLVMPSFLVVRSTLVIGPLPPHT